MNFKTFWRRYGGVTTSFLFAAFLIIAFLIKETNPWYYIAPAILIGWGIASFFNGDTKLK